MALGTHLSVLLELSRELPNATTEEVCSVLIKPKTLALQCAYIELLSKETLTSGLPAIAPASCFVSHAWKCKFADVVDCLRQHNEKHPDTYFWFDLVSNNQHKATSYPFEWWCTTFKESIRNIGNVLLIMAPWNDPIPLKRAWCLFEIFSAIDVHAKMNIAIPSSQHDEFVMLNNDRSLQYSPRDIIGIITGLDGRRGEASNPEDKQQIFAAVDDRIRGGFATLNNTIKILLKEWYSSVCLELAERYSRDGQDNTHTYIVRYCYELRSKLNHIDLFERPRDSATPIVPPAAAPPPAAAKQWCLKCKKRASLCSCSG